MDAQSPSPKIIPIPNNFLLDHQNIPALNDLVFTLPSIPIPAHFIDYYPQLLDQIASDHHSRVLVVSREEMHRFPEQINVVPSLQEAYDIIEMERIERELGL